MPLPIVLACATDAGNVRSQNEDAVAGDEQARFAVLADGMGGHNAGEVASRIATEVVSSTVKARGSAAHVTREQVEALVTSDIAAANAAVFHAARSNARFRGMGTTLVVALWHEAGVTFGHVGDSRLYLLRDGKLQQLTRDHTLVQEQLERGAITFEQARSALNRNVLTRAVGIDPVVTADVRTVSARGGDLFLLCSDGLTDMLSDDTISEILNSSPGPVASMAQRLVDAANAAGGLDNVSVILART